MTKPMQQRIQEASAVKPDEALGVEERADMNMFTNTWDKHTKLNDAKEPTKRVVSRRPQRAG